VAAGVILWTGFVVRMAGGIGSQCGWCKVAVRRGHRAISHQQQAVRTGRTANLQPENLSQCGIVLQKRSALIYKALFCRRWVLWQLGLDPFLEAFDCRAHRQAPEGMRWSRIAREEVCDSQIDLVLLRS